MSSEKKLDHLNRAIVQSQSWKIINMWTKVFILVTAFDLVLSTEIQRPTSTARPTICPQLPKKCYCNGADYLLRVKCLNLNDLQSIVEPLNTYFDNITINIKFRNSSFSSIPPNAFGNITVNEICFNRGNTRNVDNQAFNGIGLKALLWLYIPGFVSIPEAAAVHDLVVLKITHSNLTSVGLEIQNITTLSEMDVSYNNITLVHPDSFLNCVSLRKLILSHNHIQVLDRNIFRNVHNLIELYLENNLLKSIVEVLLPTRHSIQELYLGGNLFTNISSIFQSSAPNLEILHIRRNPLKTLKDEDFRRKFLKLNNLGLDGISLNEIGAGTFRQIPELGTLFLRNNMIYDFPVNSLPTSLKELYLDSNFLTNVSGVFKNSPGLTVLTLNNNRIKYIGGMFDLMTNLNKLDLSRNLIESIPNGSFVNLPSLQFLKLSHNRIQYLNNGSFIGLNQKLMLLDLTYNYIQHLAGAFSGKRLLTNLRKLWLFSNNIQELSDTDFSLDNVMEIDLGRNNLSSLNGAFLYVTSLKSLKLEFNKLETIERFNFPKRDDLKQLYLKGNPWSCDCRLLWLVDALKSKGHHHISIDHLSVCSSPKWLKDFYLHRLKPYLVKTWKDDCPVECKSCKCYPRLGNITIYVNCQGRNLTSIPSVYPAQTVLLNLSDNSLEKLPKELAQYVPHLENLDLRKNLLTNLDGVDLPLGLVNMNLSKNHFSVFPKEALSNLVLKNVELSENPWLCDCNANDFRLWLLKNIRVVNDINETQCSHSDVNGRLEGQRISSLAELDLCPVRLALYAIIAIGILAFLLSAAGGFIGYIRYRMPIKVWLYTKGLCLRWVKEEDLDEDKEYDAFVAFSSEEQHCVDKILTELEMKPPHFKLCIHYRDFIGGELILENIARAVTSSKKTLILLSKSFLESEWTMQEFRQAHHQTMEEKINRIILVLVGDLPPNEEINEDVRAYLKTATYLRWEDKYLWQKLRYAMPRNPVPREERNTETSTESDYDEELLLRVPDFD